MIEIIFWAVGAVSMAIIGFGWMLYGAEFIPEPPHLGWLCESTTFIAMSSQMVINSAKAAQRYTSM